MSDTIEFCCKVTSTDTSVPLAIDVQLNGISMFQSDHVNDIYEIKFNIDDAEAVQKLQFIMSGKTAEHTKIDDHGTIIADAMIEITRVTIDGIDINQLFINKTQYNHDFNGSQAAVVDQFYGCMGCNGNLTFEFSTPIYLWLLENM